MIDMKTVLGFSILSCIDGAKFVFEHTKEKCFAIYGNLRLPCFIGFMPINANAS